MDATARAFFFYTRSPLYYPVYSPNKGSWILCFDFFCTFTTFVLRIRFAITQTFTSSGLFFFISLSLSLSLSFYLFLLALFLGFGLLAG